MRLAPLYVTLALVVLARSENLANGDDDSITGAPVDGEKQLEKVEEPESGVDVDEDDSEALKIEDPLDPKNAELPILPPIILLDFGNDDNDDNSTSGDEKSKRTIDGSLGYGFARNNLFSGKSNYYFPAGKSGTTVSIEESISPFLPRTIIENVKPISERPFPGDQNSGYGQNPLKNSVQPASGQQTNGQMAQSTNGQAQPIGSGVRYSQPIFGQRTKLYKPSQIDYSAYQGYSSTPKSPVESYTTLRPDSRANGFVPSQNSYSTQKPGFSATSFTSGFPQSGQTTPRPFSSYSTTPAPSYATSTPSPYQTRYTGKPGNSYATPRPSFDNPTTLRPSNLGSQGYSPDSPLASFANLPRFTVENGVRYENKIVWKYPDGKISPTPPTSYINAYNEFLSKQNPGVAPPASSYQTLPSGSSFPNAGASGSYQSQVPAVKYQHFPSQTSFQSPNYQSQFVRYQNPQEIRYSPDSLGNIHSKSPAQFPNDQGLNKPARPSQFVSSASLQSANFAVGSRAPQGHLGAQGQQYDLGYQGQFGLKTAQRQGNPLIPPGPSSGYVPMLKDHTKLLQDSYGSIYGKERLIPQYEVNSPNPEYTYTTESAIKGSTPSSSSLLTPKGTLAPKILSKYSTQAQKYLTKVFTPEKTRIRDYQTSPTHSSPQSYSTSSTPFINTDYENLLNYNPSISQYIRNPSSILKAQPTYIQAGNSLIPVIILRVDGAPPIQPTATPNINLKALLQQYLTNYANSIGQNGNNNNNNNVPNGSPYGNPPGAQQNSLYDLNQLAQSLSQYSQDPSIANSFAKQFDAQSPYETTNSFPSRTSYDSSDKSGISGGPKNYGTRTNKPQKVKSVQIIEDPRFTSYKVNS